MNFLLQAWERLRQRDPGAGSWHLLQYSFMLGRHSHVVSFAPSIFLSLWELLTILPVCSFLAYGAFKILQLFFFSKRLSGWLPSHLGANLDRSPPSQLSEVGHSEP